MDPAQVLAAGLAEQGATVAFGVPGGGPNLDVVGAFVEHDIDFVLAHAETASCIMAATWGWLTGSVTAAVVTRGPGAASAVNGAAQATLDRQPLIVVSDTVPAVHRERVPHQRIDQGQMFAPVTKGTTRWGADATPELMHSVAELAKRAPAGAVHLDYDASGRSTPIEPLAVADSEAPDVATARKLIADAQRPVVIIGVGAAASPDVRRISDAIVNFGAPVLSTYQGIGVLATEHDLSAGLFTNGESERPLLEAADLVVTVGLDMVEPIPAAWPYQASVLALADHPTGDPYLPITTEVIGGLGGLTEELLRPSSLEWDPTTGREQRERVRTDLRASESSDTFGPLRLVSSLTDALPEALTVTVDAGAHFLAIMPMWPVPAEKRLLISNGLATMGYAVPAAIGAAFARPDEPVLALTGDGGLGMCLAELETIVRHNLAITVVVFNDAALSLIEIKQLAHHGGEQAVRYRATDFAAVAEAMGMPAQVATNRSELDRLLERHRFDGPFLIDARIDPTSYPELLRVTRG